MSVHLQNYFRYFAETPEAVVWGLDVTAAGYTRIPRGATYPPARHPVDHEFTWKHGRVLDAVQIVLISDGRGHFETQRSGLQEIVAGDAFVILPGVWHRYEPYKEWGWEESWIEVRGRTVDGLIASGIFTDTDVIRHRALDAGMYEALESVHMRSKNGRPGFDAGRAAAAFTVLATWQLAAQSAPHQSRLSSAVAEAERFLAEHYNQAIDIPQLARTLGVAYSHFRRAFRAQTGFAPWQYMLHLRLSRARRMLASSDATLDQISEKLKFSSASHLSAAFKKAFGTSPTAWRKSVNSLRPGAVSAKDTGVE